MCQLTFLHGDADVVKSYLSGLTLLNSLDNNQDGHGYVVLPEEESKSPKAHIWKTSKDGASQISDFEYYDRLNKYAGNRDKLSIMSHVRAASINTTVDINNAHPFRIKNLILMHNGTLSPENEEDEIEKTIDSYWFLKKLSDTVGEDNKLKAKHISKAMKSFRGKFAFLIYDLKQPYRVFIVRGRTAPLHYATYYSKSNKNKKVFVVNTSEDNIKANLAPIYLKNLGFGEFSTPEIRKFNKESIYIYNIKESRLYRTKVDIKERYASKNSGSYGESWFERQTRQNSMGYGWRGGSSRANNSSQRHSESTRAIGRILDMADEMALTMTDLNIHHIMLADEPILFATTESLKVLSDYLSEIQNGVYKRRAGKKHNLWKEILNAHANKEDRRISSLEVYDEYDIKFPWFITPRKRLENVLSSIKSGN